MPARRAILVGPSRLLLLLLVRGLWLLVTANTVSYRVQRDCKANRANKGCVVVLSDFYVTIFWEADNEASAHRTCLSLPGLNGKTLPRYKDRAKAGTVNPHPNKAEPNTTLPWLDQRSIVHYSSLDLMTTWHWRRH